MRLVTTSADMPVGMIDVYHDDKPAKRHESTSSPVRWPWLTAPERSALLRVLHDRRAQIGGTITPVSIGLPRGMLETLVQLDWLSTVSPYQFEDQTRTSRAGYMVRPIAWAQALRDGLVKKI